MQGTVATFDPHTQTGTLLLDDGTELRFGTAAFRFSGLRLLHQGQRLVVESDPTGAVTGVRLPGID